MKVIIIEDEELASARLERMLLAYNPRIHIIAKLESVEESINWFKHNPAPDLIFLDIHLEDGISFSIFENVDVPSPIIFTTAFDEYAIKAFKLKSIDYLLKPIVQSELNNAINKYSELIGSQDKSNLIDINSLYDMIKSKNYDFVEYKTRFAVQVGQKIKTFNIDEIAYFFSENSCTYFITKGKSRYSVDETLDSLETVLHPNEFFRVNRSHIVKIDSISNVAVYPKSRLKLDLNPPSEKEVFVSSEKSANFKQWLNK